LLAIGEAKARFRVDDKKPLGAYYDFELLQVDEKNNMQILLYGSLSRDENDILPGHIWVEREFLEVQNMKYYCPTVLQACLKEQRDLVEHYHRLDDGTLKPQEEILLLREKREDMKAKLDMVIEQQTSLKWVNRVIMWCADKMPSFGDSFLGEKSSISDTTARAADVVEKAIANNMMTDARNNRRRALLKKVHCTAPLPPKAVEDGGSRARGQ